MTVRTAGGDHAGPLRTSRRLAPGTVRINWAGAPIAGDAEVGRGLMVDGVWITIIKGFVLVNLLMGFFAVMTWVERRLIGRFQVRLGPNRVGPAGLLQPIADLGKLLRKQSMIPDGARPRLYLLAPFVSLFCAIGAFGLMPFGGVVTVPGTDIQIHLYMADSNVALLFVAATRARSASTACWSAAGRRARSTRCSAACARSRSWCRTRWRSRWP